MIRTVQQLLAESQTLKPGNVMLCRDCGGFVCFWSLVDESGELRKTPDRIVHIKPNSPCKEQESPPQTVLIVSPESVITIRDEILKVNRSARTQLSTADHQPIQRNSVDWVAVVLFLLLGVVLYSLKDW